MSGDAQRPGARPRQGDPARRARGRVRTSGAGRRAARSGSRRRRAPAAGACASRPGASRRRPATTAPAGRALAAIVRRLEAPGARLRRRRAGAVARGAGQLGGARGRGGARGGSGGGRAPTRRQPSTRRSPRPRRSSTATLPASTRRPPTSGVAGRFSRDGGWRPVPVLQAITTVRRPVRPAARHRRAGRRRRRGCASGSRSADDILALLGELADEAGAALAQGRRRRAGPDRSTPRTALLGGAARLSSPSWTRWSHAARAAGAIGAKLTGAGGGGAVIALAPGPRARRARALARRRLRRLRGRDRRDAGSRR